MLSRADSVGVFQVESRAQMSMLPRLKPKEFYDLVIEVAIVRPGPIQGDMVHPYLKRRESGEEIVYPSPSPEHGPRDELKKVLEKTKGVPLFQEQAMSIAMVAARFSPDEADGLRRAMATFRNDGNVHLFETRFVEGMVTRGYARDFAERCFNQIKGFGNYGFPESHAASFAKLVYVSAWIKCHYPDVFCAAILNSQPMGFYQPAQLVRDAREHGVEVRPPDVNASGWACTLDRRAALWAVRGLDERGLNRNGDALARPAPLLTAFRGDDLFDEPAVSLPPMPFPEQVAEDYVATGLSLKAHPIGFFRPMLRGLGAITAAEHRNEALPVNSRVTVAGLVLMRQRPGTAKGVAFLTLEDETGIANVIVWRKLFEAERRVAMTARFLAVRGRLQREELVIHVLAEAFLDLTGELPRLRDGEDTIKAFRKPASDDSRPDSRLVKSRDFH
jgi:error-prone DNA polymerase